MATDIDSAYHYLKKSGTYEAKYEHFHDWEAAFACYKAVACDDELPDGEYTACLRGRAYRRLARCYRFGRGVEVDAAEADRLTRLAAQSGNQNAEIIIDSLIHAE